MLMLDFWQEALEWVFNLIPRLLNIIWAIICVPIYNIIAVCYDTFIALSKLDILKSEEIAGIYQRITMILIIVMAFYISFEVVKYVVQPDNITHKEKGAGSLVTRIGMVVLLLAFIPDIFSVAYKLQAKIIDSNIIGRIILGNQATEEEDTTLLTSAGSNFAGDVFGMFYYLNTTACPLDEERNLIESKAADITKCKNAKKIVDSTIAVYKNGLLGSIGGGVMSAITGSFGQAYTANVDTNGDGIADDIQSLIEFQGLLALIVGGYICWSLLVYGVELAKRYFQLVFLQITSPIAIISYLSPKKDGTFQKWVKQCMTTYLDVFLRLALINFILLILNKISAAFFGSNTTVKLFMNNVKISGFNPFVLMLLYVLIIVGLLSFVKKAPKMLKELLPGGNAASGEFGMSGKELIGNARTIWEKGGATIGTVARTAADWKNTKGMGTKERILSAGKTAKNSALAGFKKGGGYNKATNAGNKTIEENKKLRADGGTVSEQMIHGEANRHKLAEYDQIIADKKSNVEEIDGVSSYGEKAKVNKTAATQRQQLEERHRGTASTRTNFVKKVEDAYNAYTVNGNNRDEYQRAVNAALEAVYDPRNNETTIALSSEIDTGNQKMFESVFKSKIGSTIQLNEEQKRMYDRLNMSSDEEGAPTTTEKSEILQRMLTEFKENIGSNPGEIVLTDYEKEIIRNIETRNRELEKQIEVEKNILSREKETVLQEQLSALDSEDKNVLENHKNRIIEAHTNARKEKRYINDEGIIESYTPSDNEVPIDIVKFSQDMGKVKKREEKEITDIQINKNYKAAKANTQNSGSSSN